jgi:hypothetical protein
LGCEGRRIPAAGSLAIVGTSCRPLQLGVTEGKLTFVNLYYRIRAVPGGVKVYDRLLGSEALVPETVADKSSREDRLSFIPHERNVDNRDDNGIDDPHDKDCDIEVTQPPRRQTDIAFDGIIKPGTLEDGRHGFANARKGNNCGGVLVTTCRAAQKSLKSLLGTITLRIWALFSRKLA